MYLRIAAVSSWYLAMREKGPYGDGDQGAIGAEELVDLLGHGKRIVSGVNVQSLFTCVPV